MNFRFKDRVPPLRGVIIKDDGLTQVVETDSREQGKRFVHLPGNQRVADAKVGDRLKLFYRVKDFSEKGRRVLLPGEVQMMAYWQGKKV